jgi:hypothetical protein
MRKRSAHLTRLMVEGVSNYSEYKGGRLNYVRDYDPAPTINVDLTSKMDIDRAISILYKRKELSKQEVLMLKYVMADGRLSRRDISAMIKEEHDIDINQRTISRRLESAYWKIQSFLGFEYSDGRIFKMVAKQKGYPQPYILSDDEIDKAQVIMERV